MAHNEFPGDVDSPDAGIRVSRRIADELRRTRVARNLSIEDVAAILKIRSGFIRAMEEDRFDDLPGPAYISGFLRTYANHLGLDGDQLVAWFKDDSRSTFAPREMELPVPISEIRRPTFPIITVSLVVAVGIAVAWYVYQESLSIDIDLIPEVPGPVAEGVSTGLPEDEGPGALDGDGVFATVGDGDPDTMLATVEPADGTEHVAETHIPPDVSGTTGDAGDAAMADVAPDSADTAGDGGPEDGAAGVETPVLPDTAGISGDGSQDTGDAAAAGVAPDSAGISGDGGQDTGDAAAADVAPDSADTAGDGGPEDGAAGVETPVLPDTAGISGDGSQDTGDAAAADVAPDSAGRTGDGGQDTGDDDATDVPPDSADDAVSGVEADPPRDDAGVALQDVADATGAAAGADESWDEPVFASEDTVQEAAVADERETDSQHTIYGTPGAGSRIELRAIAETWVQVTTPDGVAVLTHILLPGDVYHVPGRNDLMLDTGNAGGLEIRVDGEPVPSLGGAGAVVRDILLSVESLTRR